MAVTSCAPSASSPSPAGTNVAAALRTFSGKPRASWRADTAKWRSEEHTSELQSQSNLVCRLLLEKKKKKKREELQKINTRKEKNRETSREWTSVHIIVD